MDRECACVFFLKAYCPSYVALQLVGLMSKASGSKLFLLARLLLEVVNV